MLLLAALAANSAIALDWQAPWREPHDAAAAANRSDEYAWRLFVALNWPASPMTRAADRTAQLGADRPVFGSPGRAREMSIWRMARIQGLGARRPRASGRAPAPLRDAFPARSAEARHIVDGAMVPLADPIAAAKRLTEIRMNRQTYEYIRARELYTLEGQIRAFDQNRTVSFPLWRQGSQGEMAAHQRKRKLALSHHTGDALPMARNGSMGSRLCTSSRRIYPTGSGRPSNRLTIRRWRTARDGSCRPEIDIRVPPRDRLQSCTA